MIFIKAGSIFQTAFFYFYPMKYLTPVFLLLAFLIGGYASYAFFTQKEQVTEKETVILLEKIRKVFKLVTVEGEFMERYTEKNIRPITVYMPFAKTFNFPKEASILVTGKVLVGYDMKKASITMDGNQKKVFIRNLPQAEILAIDHDIKYENLSESYFNEFTKDDYTQLAKNAKAELHNKALDDQLLAKAAQQGNDILEVIDALVSTFGWTLEVDDYSVEQLLE